ncbi:MAG: hypothetical protein GQ572_11000 [Gammaproteobacteria bacterium]|nr:hypothetical protein [Gammaproteobacteria bacterium]
MFKPCWSIVIILSLVTVGMAYKFIIQGEVIEEPDSRTTILLTQKERDLVLFEMRIFLQSVQQITSGISADDMDLVASSARKSGRNAQIAVPGTLIGKLPIAFKKLGFDTHAKFDELALDAEQLGDGEHTVTQLGTLLENCVSCHSAFKFNIE